MKCTPPILRLLALIAVALALPPAACGFGGFGAQALPSGGIALSLTTETHWRDDGGARVEARVTVHGEATEPRSGELRAILVGINGRIDFESVTFRMRRDSAREPLPAEAGLPSNGFLVVPDFSVTAGGERRLMLEVELPAKTHRSGVPLQVIVVARGQLPDGGGEWMSSARDGIEGSGAAAAAPSKSASAPDSPEGEHPPADKPVDTPAE